MCTVSYIPNKETGGFVLTSNRDEKVFRPTVQPEIYKVGETSVAFPKDEKAGGSWIAANNRGRLCCLLNGAFVAHKKKPFYAQSRGNVLVEAVSSLKTPEQFFAQKDLFGVEPFTIVTVEHEQSKINHFSKFVWDGSRKYFKKLNPGKPYIWSSVTLYSAEHRKMREEWFNQYLHEKKGRFLAEEIFEFHKGNHTNDKSVNVIMEREGGLKTVSITQIIPENKKFRMNYFDLHNQQNHILLI